MKRVLQGFTHGIKELFEVYTFCWKLPEFWIFVLAAALVTAVLAH